MTNDNRRVNDHSMFTSKTPHFFKIILNETIRDGKLGIPRKFVRNYGNQLPSSIQLEVPSGAIWQVELTKSDGMVWLQKGWKEFAEHYSVEFGHFLVFRYEGNAHFHVLIFDKSASEMEYPYTSTEDDDLSDEICEEVSASRKSKEKSQLPCPPPHKKMRIDSPNQPGTDLNSEILSSPISADKLGNLEKAEKSRCSTGQLDGVLGPATKEVGGITDTRSVNTEVYSCLRILTATEKARVARILPRFRASRSTENPVFMAVIKPTALCYKYQMSIPSNFARKFVTTLKGILTLCDSTGKTWSVKFSRRSENEWPQAIIYGGWRAFAEDNNLRVGDICFFELIKHPEIILKVFIYPAVENAYRPRADGNIASRVKIRSLASDTEANCRHSRCPSSSREYKDPKFKGNENVDSDIEILDDFPVNLKTKKELASPFFQPCKMMRTNPRCNQASAFKSPNPSFSVRMQPSYVGTGSVLYIPSHFARRYFKENGEVTLRVSDGRTWRVDYKCRLNARGKFRCASWGPFVRDNNLKVGDVCVFELIKENGRFLDVHFFSC